MDNYPIPDPPFPYGEYPQSKCLQPKPEYSSAESVFAWLCILFGYLFCRLFPGTDTHLGGFLFLNLLFGVTLTTVLIRKIRPRFSALLALFSAVLVSFSLLIGGAKLGFFANAYALASYLYFVSASFGNTLEKGLSSLLLFDFLRAVFVLPFCAFSELFRGLAGKTSEGKKKAGKTVALALLGLALAIVPTAVIIRLLGYDSDFKAMIARIFSWDLREFLSRLFSLACGLPVAMYLFGAYSSSREKKGDTIGASAEKRHTDAQKAQIAPAVTACLATLPILAVYVLFFVTQWKYFVSGFAGRLPEGITYADYARSGFFELFAVSCINLAILTLLGLFLRRKNGKSGILNLLTLLFSLSSLILMATAAAKMVMYVRAFGLTPLRFYSSCIMGLLALLFLLLPVLRFCGSRKILPVCLILSIAALLCILVLPVNSMVADYNVDRYIDGTLETVDVEYLTSLDYAAVPAAYRLREYWNTHPEKGGDAAAILENWLTHHCRLLYTTEFFDWNVEKWRAKGILDQIVKTNAQD